MFNIKKIIFSVLFLFLIIGGFNSVSAEAPKLEINLFYSAVCPHCITEREYLKTLKTKYPEIQINEYEVFYNSDNQKLLQDFYQKYNVKSSERGYVPANFISEKYFIGFNQQIENEIGNYLGQYFGENETISPKIKIPIFGEIDTSKTPMFLITVVLGTLDGFNPCAMWVLVILISMLLTLKSRKKILLIGGTFIFVEGLLYFLFMSAWLNVFMVLSFISIIRILIGIFGIVFGVLRIKDFITWKPGVCKVTDETKSEVKILDKIKNVIKPTTLPATILGVVALAFSVNLVEFLCSAGFPVMYAKILASQNIGTLTHYLYLLLYNFFYMLDDFIVFGVAFFTLSRFGFSEKYNKYSTLVAGILILVLGILLIFKPQFLMFG